MNTQKDYFNLMAEKWDTVCKHDTSKIECILNMLNIKNGAKILDVGTGTGVLIPFLTERVGEQGEVTAVDFSDKMLEIAQRKYTGANVIYICGDILDCCVPKEYFDFAICYSVFPHFKDKQLAIEAISQYLNKNGKLLICHSESREVINTFHKNIPDIAAEGYLPPMNVIKGCFENAGLKVITEIDNDEMFVAIAAR